MVGKRPYQIRRTTSTSQLRAPPSSRPRISTDLLTSSISADQKIGHEDHHHVKLPEQALQEDALFLHHHHHRRVDPSAVSNIHSDHTSLSLAGPHVYGIGKPCFPVILQKSELSGPSFLDACYSCKRPLGHGRDIFMYRGDAAFCTEECRLKQMARDELLQSTASRNNGICSISNGSDRKSKNAT